MNMEITYELGFEEQEAHRAYLHGPMQKPNFFRPILFSVLLCALGSVAAFKAESIGLFAIFLFVAAIQITDAAKKSFTWKKVVQASIDTDIPNNIKLVINDKGIQETIEDQVVSFAPWAAVGSYLQLDEVWAFNLVGGYTALVPAGAITDVSSTAENELKALLQRHDIPSEA